MDFQNETTGWSQLHSAAAEGNVQVIEFLIRNGANLHLKDENESTPLWLASKNGKLFWIIKNTVKLDPFLI